MDNSISVGKSSKKDTVVKIELRVNSALLDKEKDKHLDSMSVEFPIVQRNMQDVLHGSNEAV